MTNRYDWTGANLNILQGQRGCCVLWALGAWQHSSRCLRLDWVGYRKIWAKSQYVVSWSNFPEDGLFQILLRAQSWNLIVGYWALISFSWPWMYVSLLQICFCGMLFLISTRARQRKNKTSRWVHCPPFYRFSVHSKDLWGRNPWYIIDNMADTSTKKTVEDTKPHEEEEDDKKDGTLSLSHTRVRRIVKSDPDTKQIANDSVYLICRATVRI